MDADMAQLKHSNNKYYASTFKYIDIDKEKKKSKSKRKIVVKFSTKKMVVNMLMMWSLMWLNRGIIIINTTF